MVGEVPSGEVPSAKGSAAESRRLGIFRPFFGTWHFLLGTSRLRANFRAPQAIIMSQKSLRIALGADHGGVDLKNALVAHLQAAGHEVTDFGTHGTESVDYPDYGYKLAEAVAAGDPQFGVALCGSGIGISIAVNRNPACRCAVVSEQLSAYFSRDHNDANVIAMGARMIGIEQAKACLDTFLSTPFGGDRHTRRVDKLSQPTFSKESA